MNTENKKILNKEEINENESTLGIDEDDYLNELERYGITESEDVLPESDEPSVEEVKKAPKKSFFIQKPILIAALSFVLVAVIVLGSVFVYNNFLKPGIEGAYTWSNSMELVGMDTGNTYFIFDKDGNVTYDRGCEKLSGTYTLEETEDDITVLNSQFLYFGMLGGSGTYTKTSDDEFTLNFQGYELKFIKAELPEYKIDSNDMKHASVDEVEVKSMNIDEKLVGTWSEELDEYSLMQGYIPRTFTFNDDGTGVMSQSYDLVDTQGYYASSKVEFTYTVYGSSILITAEFYSGETTDVLSIDNYTFRGNVLVMTDRMGTSNFQPTTK